MRISDWSSDVCSSDLNSCRKTEDRRRNHDEDTDARVHPDRADGCRCNHRDPGEHCLSRVHRLHRQDASFGRCGMPAGTGAIHGALLHDQHGIQQCGTADHGLQDRTERALFVRSEEHTSELQSLMRISYAVFCLKTKKKHHTTRVSTYSDDTTSILKSIQ